MKPSLRNRILVVGWALWCVLIAILFVVLSTGCGTESGQSAQIRAPTPAPLDTPGPQADCNPPITPAAGHVVRGYTYRVCSGSDTVQQVTVYVDTAPIGPDWPAAGPCVEDSTDQVVCK